MRVWFIVSTGLRHLVSLTFFIRPRVTRKKLCYRLYLLLQKEVAFRPRLRPLFESVGVGFCLVPNLKLAHRLVPKKVGPRVLLDRLFVVSLALSRVSQQLGIVLALYFVRPVYGVRSQV